MLVQDQIIVYNVTRFILFSSVLLAITYGCIFSKQCGTFLLRTVKNCVQTMLWWIVFILLGVLFYIKILKPQQYWKEKNVPHKKPIPVLGNMLDAFMQKLSMAEGMLKTSQEYKNYRYYGIYQLWKPMLMVHDIDLIKQITIKDFDSFTDHLTFASDKMDPLFANSLFLVKGQKWRHIRSALSPAFTSSKMKSMFNLMSECAEQFTEYFIKNAEPNKNTTVEMKDIFTRYANDVIATCAFGVKCDSLSEQSNEFYIMGKRATDFDGINGLKMFGYTVCQSAMEFFKVRLHELDIQAFFRTLVMSTMEKREKQGIIRPDMIHLLMQARKGNLKYEENATKDETAGYATVEESNIGKERNKNKNIDLSDDDLTAQALAFFFAGFDSSSTLLCHLAHELAINPEIQENLQSEIDETLRNCENHKIKYDAIVKMKYIDMIVSETLRKWAPAAVTTRVCTKPYIIEPVLPEEQQVTLEKGDIIFIPIYAIHHNPEYFPNPERFDPERFSDENKDNIKAMTFLPFGAGPRNCIGSRFALLETKTLLVYLLSKFNIVVDEKTQIPLKLSKSNFNMTAEKGFWLGLQPRTT